MKNLCLKSFLFLFVALTVIIGWVLAIIKDLNLSKLVEFATLIPNIVTIELILFYIFVSWGWRWKKFRGWLVLCPDLNGTWVGDIQSDWVNPEAKEKMGLIPAMLTIKQDLLNISCMMHTGEMKSQSFSESFQLDKSRQVQTLCYLYSSKPGSMIRERSAQHDGAVMLDIITESGLKLIGQYWTARKTVGEIHLTYRSKEILQELPEDLKSHSLRCY